MKAPKKIDFEVLDSEIINLINASAKIFPISKDDIDTNNNPNNYEYGKCYVESDNITYLYRWQDIKWVMLGADDKDIDWLEIKNKPISYQPITHIHTKTDITDFPTLSKVSSSGNYNDLNNKPTIPTDTNQLTKTDVYTKGEVNTALSGKSDTVHNHDGRYYTEGEIDTKLTTKSDTTHNHDANYQPKGNYASSTHNHDTIYAMKGIETIVAQNTNDIQTLTTNQMNGDSHSNISVLQQLTQALLDAWNSAVTHISDSVKHITSGERTLWNTVSSKANSTHSHTSIDITVDSTHRFVTDVEKSTWNTVSNKADTTTVNSALANKADSTTVSGHTGNTTIHVTQTDKDTWNSKANSNHSHSKTDISDFPTLSTVATTGSYADLSNKPTIPTQTSQLTNNSGFKKISVQSTTPTGAVSNDLWIDTN